jgi:hypothetical protein
MQNAFQIWESEDGIGWKFVAECDVSFTRFEWPGTSPSADSSASTTLN